MAGCWVEEVPWVGEMKMPKEIFNLVDVVPPWLRCLQVRNNVAFVHINARKPGRHLTSKKQDLGTFLASTKTKTNNKDKDKDKDNDKHNICSVYSTQQFGQMHHVAVIMHLNMLHIIIS